jgi:lipopolysaccharide export LptBFGC system permease protein LptF
LTERTFAARSAFDGTWRAEQVWTRQFQEDGSPSPMSFTEMPRVELALEAPEYFKTEHPDAERMSYRQLSTYIEELQASGFDVVQLAVALHRKLSFPFVSLILTLIAVPFAVTTGRRGALYGIGVGIVLAVTYWIVISVFAAIGSAGLVAAPLAAWTPNVLFGASAVFLLLTVRT